MKFSEKKWSDSEAKVFPAQWKIERKNSKMSGFELRIFRSGRFRIQNNSNNHILEKKYFPETQFLNSIFIEKPGFDEKFTSEKKRFDSICSGKNNIVFTFRAYFKRHDFEVNLFFENQSLKWNFQKKSDQILKQKFSLHNEKLNEKIPKCQVLNWEFFVPADFEYKTIRIIIFWRRNIFQKLSFWVQFLLRNQISIKNSQLKKNVLTQFAPQKTTTFSLFVLILKGMILKQAFPLKIRVWNEILWNDSDFEAYLFL